MGWQTVATREAQCYSSNSLASKLCPWVLFVASIAALGSLKRCFCLLRKMSVDQPITSSLKVDADSPVCKISYSRTNRSRYSANFRRQPVKLSSIAAPTYLRSIQYLRKKRQAKSRSLNLFDDLAQSFPLLESPANLVGRLRWENKTIKPPYGSDVFPLLCTTDRYRRHRSWTKLSARGSIDAVSGNKSRAPVWNVQASRQQRKYLTYCYLYQS